MKSTEPKPKDLVARYKECLRELYGEECLDKSSISYDSKIGFYRISLFIPDNPQSSNFTLHRPTEFRKMLSELTRRVGEMKMDEAMDKRENEKILASGAIAKAEDDEMEEKTIVVTRELLENIQSTMWLARTFITESDVGAKNLIKALENHCQDIKKAIK